MFHTGRVVQIKTSIPALILKATSRTQFYDFKYENSSLIN